MIIIKIILNLIVILMKMKVEILLQIENRHLPPQMNSNI